jgi:hypothetical protein
MKERLPSDRERENVRSFNESMALYDARQQQRTPEQRGRELSSFADQLQERGKESGMISSRDRFSR